MTKMFANILNSHSWSQILTHVAITFTEIPTLYSFITTNISKDIECSALSGGLYAHSLLKMGRGNRPPLPLPFSYTPLQKFKLM